MTWESVSKLAALTGVARATVMKRCEGLPTKNGPKRAILMESREALPRIFQVNGPQHLEMPTKDQHERLAKMRADREELVVQEMRGDLIRVNTAVDTWQHMLAACRAKLLSLGARLATQVAAIKDAVECKELMDAVVHEALGELSETGLPDEIADRLAQGAGGSETATETDGK